MTETTPTAQQTVFTLVSQVYAELAKGDNLAACRTSDKARDALDSYGLNGTEYDFLDAVLFLAEKPLMGKWQN